MKNENRPRTDVKGRLGSELRLPAIEVLQGENRTLYSFAVDGKQLQSFTTISRVHRDGQAHLRGYQRAEVLSHIAVIRRYVESSNPMIPNALVVAFDSRVRFQPNESGGPKTDYARPGTLIIPVDPDCPENERPGWIVDGQQRCAAIREAAVDVFPICITSFITSSDAEQRAQFILVNSTKPLPKGLIYELLPTTSGALPPALQLRQFPAGLLERLNYDSDSPLRGLIRTPTNPEGMIKDNSILRMLETSLTDGALYPYRDPANGNGDVESCLRVIKDYWAAVKSVFPGAWAKPPRQSRLMHGVGIVCLGFVMDAIVGRYERDRVPSVDDFVRDLEPLREICRWTSGNWEFAPQHQRKWDELQNTSKDIKLLTNFLLVEYRARVWPTPVGVAKEA